MDVTLVYGDNVLQTLVGNKGLFWFVNGNTDGASDYLLCSFNKRNPIIDAALRHNLDEIIPDGRARVIISFRGYRAHAYDPENFRVIMTDVNATTLTLLTKLRLFL
jgi:hypothetical protein